MRPKATAPALRVLRRAGRLQTTPSLRPGARSLATMTPATCMRRPHAVVPATTMAISRLGAGRKPHQYGQGQRRWKSEDHLKSRNKSGPFSLKAGLLFAVTGGILIWFFDHEKERMRQKRMAEANKGIGKPRVGGPFELVDTDGNRFTDEDLKGRYSLIYFGFSHCPDICPEELDKMATMYDIVQKARPNSLLPIFVTCDPARDDPKTLVAYLREFHPDFIGLTGTYDQVKAACKAYRVYFSTPEKVKPGEDYLVDHSIYFYIMDPEGDFVEVLGRQHSPEEGARIILGHMKDWKGVWRK